MIVKIPTADDEEEEEDDEEGLLAGYPWEKRAEATTNKRKSAEENEPKKARPTTASLAKWRQPDTLRVGKGHTQNQVLAER